MEFIKKKGFLNKAIRKIALFGFSAGNTISVSVVWLLLHKEINTSFWYYNLKQIGEEFSGVWETTRGTQLICRYKTEKLLQKPKLRDGTLKFLSLTQINKNSSFLPELYLLYPSRKWVAHHMSLLLDMYQMKWHYYASRSPWCHIFKHFPSQH